jgi:hypothetical protein
MEPYQGLKPDDSIYVSLSVFNKLDNGDLSVSAFDLNLSFLSYLVKA